MAACSAAPTVSNFLWVCTDQISLISFIGIFKKSTQTNHCWQHPCLLTDFPARWVSLGRDDPPKTNTTHSHYYQHWSAREINALFPVGRALPQQQSGRRSVEKMCAVNVELWWYNRWNDIHFPPCCSLWVFLLFLTSHTDFTQRFPTTKPLSLCHVESFQVLPHCFLSLCHSPIHLFPFVRNFGQNACMETSYHFHFWVFINCNNNIVEEL